MELAAGRLLAAGASCRPGQSSRVVAERAAALGAWVLPGPTMSVSGRDDVLRVAFAAVGGEALDVGLGVA